MAIRFEDVNEGLRRIVLSGRLDTVGSEQIAPRFAALTESAKGGVVVYLSGVSFLSSMAIGVLVTGAKAIQAKGGRMVLHVAENEVIIRTLEATGVNELIPTFHDALDAEKALRK
jgi:anti-anti-sigma factor